MACLSLVPGHEKEYAKAFAETHGGPNFSQTEPPTDADIENFINNEAFAWLDT